MLIERPRKRRRPDAAGPASSRLESRRSQSGPASSRLESRRSQSGPAASRLESRRSQYPAIGGVGGELDHCLEGNKLD
jgi:hypothetical protein